MAVVSCKDVDCERLLKKLKEGFTPEELEQLGGAGSPKAQVLRDRLMEIFRKCCSLEGKPVDEGPPGGTVVGGTVVAAPAIPKPVVPSWVWLLIAILVLAAMPKRRRTCFLVQDMGLFCIYDCGGTLVTIDKPYTSTGRCKQVVELWV